VVVDATASKDAVAGAIAASVDARLGLGSGPRSVRARTGS
jgi:hypothetical protein